MSKVVALDANLVVLLVVGLANPAWISTHKRLRAYGTRDYDLLVRLLQNAREVVVTPSVLTEASNLVSQIEGDRRTKVMKEFRAFIGRTKELFQESASVSLRKEFVRLGLCDCALLELSKDDTVVLSADLDLYLAASRAGYTAVNFTHARVEAGILDRP